MWEANKELRVEKRMRLLRLWLRLKIHRLL